MEDARADDTWAEDAPAADAREEDARAEDARAEDAPTEDACTEDARVEDEGTGDATTEDAQLNNLSKFSIICCNNNSVHNSIFLLSAPNSAWLQNHNWVTSPHCTILIDYRCVRVCAYLYVRVCICVCVGLCVCWCLCVRYWITACLTAIDMIKQRKEETRNAFGPSLENIVAKKLNDTPAATSRILCIWTRLYLY